jgi:hypothetical protein
MSVALDGTLRVFDVETGREMVRFWAGVSVHTIAFGGAGQLIAFGDKLGRLAVLRGLNMDFGPQIITAAYLFRIDNRRSDIEATARCGWCGCRFIVPNTVLDAILETNKSANLSLDDSPCLGLPDKAWDEPRLLYECPDCSRALRFNPFVAADIVPPQLGKSEQIR